MKTIAGNYLMSAPVNIDAYTPQATEIMLDPSMFDEDDFNSENLNYEDESYY